MCDTNCINFKVVKVMPGSDSDLIMACNESNDYIQFHVDNVGGGNIKVGEKFSVHFILEPVNE